MGGVSGTEKIKGLPANVFLLTRTGGFTPPFCDGWTCSGGFTPPFFGGVKPPLRLLARLNSIRSAIFKYDGSKWDSGDFRESWDCLFSAYAFKQLAYAKEDRRNPPEGAPDSVGG